MNIRLTLRIEDIDEDVAEFILIDKNVQNENVTEWTRVEGEPVGPSYALVLKNHLSIAFFLFIYALDKLIKVSKGVSHRTPRLY